LGTLCDAFYALFRISLGRNPSPPQCPTPCRQPSLKSRRSTSVISNYSTASTYDSRTAEPDSATATEANELKKRLQDSVAETEGMKTELQIKKEEVSQLRDKVMLLSRELSEVSTTKGALNEVSTFQSTNPSSYTYFTFVLGFCE